MTTFTLDTSGEVAHEINGHNTCWNCLTPFAQGYVEAMLRDFSAQLGGTVHGGPTGVEFGFSDLAPATLARIIADCGRFESGHPSLQLLQGGERAFGRAFWSDRNNGDYSTYPPLTVYLGEDGLVYLREAA